jgi:hypothetical protein
MLLVSTAAVTAIEPEPIVSLADLHFVAPNLEVLPTGSPVEGDTVQIVGHVQASGKQVWTKMGVVLDRGLPGEQDSHELGAPTVIYDAGEYKMWYAGTTGGMTGSILYATSPDGVLWTKHGAVLDPGPSPENVNVHYPCVMKDGAVYKMWYSAYDGSSYRIFYATSPDGLTWSRQGLVLDIGPSGSYDDDFAYGPFVLKEGGSFRMWYSGSDGANVRLLYATSPDGVAWTKQGVSLNLGPPGSLENVHVSPSYILREGGGYHMWYRGSDGTYDRILYATSSDGLSWTRRGLAVDVGPPGSTDGTHVLLQSVLHLPGMPYQMWYSGRGEFAVYDRIHYAYMTSIMMPVTTEVDFYLDAIGPSSKIGTYTAQFSSLSPSIALVDWVAGPPGMRTIYAVIDPLNRISETDEINNMANISIFVRGPPMPDYVPTSPVPAPPLKVGLSMPVQLSIRVANLGSGNASADSVLAFRDEAGNTLSTFTVPPLEMGAVSTAMMATWMSPAVPGTYLVFAEADSNNDLAENNETNNVYSWTIYVVPGPITSLRIGLPKYEASVTYVRSFSLLAFFALDPGGSGIRNTTFRTDGGDWLNYTAIGHFSLSGDGGHLVEWYSIDFAGNKENISSQTVWVDDTPPTTTITPQTGPYDENTWFDLTATDSGCGVAAMEYKMDSEQWRSYDGNFTVQAGLHTIWYRSTDNIGNRETPKSREVNVESERPPDIVAGTNYKPMVATVFTIALLVAGFLSSRRRPWKNRKDRVAILQAFCAHSLPFATAEAVTGLLSLATGVLSIPPVLGLGTAVDVSILSVGLAVAILDVAGRKQKGPPPGSQDSKG